MKEMSSVLDHFPYFFPLYLYIILLCRKCAVYDNYWGESYYKLLSKPITILGQERRSKILDLEK